MSDVLTINGYPVVDGPNCGKCGAPITTGLMAAFCPAGDECEFWPTDETGEAFIVALRESLVGDMGIGIINITIVKES